MTFPVCFFPFTYCHVFWSVQGPEKQVGRGTPMNAPWGAPLYKLYRHVLPQRVTFWGLFGLKMGIHFAYFGLESRMVFEGTIGAYERIYHSNSK